MPRNPYRYVQNLLISKKKKSGRSESHIRELQRITDKFYKYLKTHRKETNPHRIDENAIRSYLETVPQRGVGCISYLPSTAF